MFEVSEVGIQIGAAVHATDGICGHAESLIVDPVHEKVTHLVVEEHEPPRIKRLVPIELVHSTRHGEIEIKCGTDQFKELDTFAEGEFIRPHAHTSSYGFWPYVEPETPLDLPEHQKLAGEISLRRGAAVYATDGFVGRLDELMIERESGKITHIVLREGHLWGHRDISIPVSEIHSIERYAVQLLISKKDVGELPEIRIRRIHR